MGTDDIFAPEGSAGLTGGFAVLAMVVAAMVVLTVLAAVVVAVLAALALPTPMIVAPTMSMATVRRPIMRRS